METTHVHDPAHRQTHPRAAQTAASRARPPRRRLGRDRRPADPGRGVRPGRAQQDHRPGGERTCGTRLRVAAHRHRDRGRPRPADAGTGAGRRAAARRRAAVHHRVRGRAARGLHRGHRRRGRPRAADRLRLLRRRRTHRHPALHRGDRPRPGAGRAGARRRGGGTLPAGRRPEAAGDRADPGPAGAGHGDPQGERAAALRRGAAPADHGRRRGPARRVGRRDRGGRRHGTRRPRQDPETR